MRTNLRSILRTSVPIVVDLTAQIIMWSIEITLVSRVSTRILDGQFPGMGITGVDALTAVGNVIQVLIVTCSLLLVFVFGATIIINRLIGAGEREEADHFLGHALFTAVVPAIAIGAIWFFLSPFIFAVVLGASEKVTAVGVDYFRTLSFFAPAIIMNFVAIGIVRGAGDTHLSMLTSLLVNGIHLVLAVFLVFGFLFFPPIGVRGSAMAAGIGHTTGCIVTFVVILRGKSALTFQWRDFSAIRWESVKKVIATGLPISLEQLTWTFGILVVIGFSNRLGTAAAAAHIIVLNYQRIFSILYQAFGMGALTLVGQRYGARRFEHVQQTSTLFFWLVGAVVAFLAAVTFLRSRYLVLLFTSDPAVVPVCTSVLKVVAFVQIPKSLSYVYSFSLRGVGENRYPLYLAVLGVLLFEVILGFNLAFTAGLSILGLWIAQGTDELFKMSLACNRFQRKIHFLKSNP